MNKQISRLFHIAQKKERHIIGLMSGTSLDGLDIVLCKIGGAGYSTSLSLLQFETLPYTDDFRRYIRTVFAQRQVDQQVLCGLNAHIAHTHATLINQALNKWNIPAEEIDLIASHGQTIFHAPQSYTKDHSLPNSTLQIGDGDHIAVHTGIITLSDFRQKHIAAGGEGAPLAAYGDYLLFSSEDENRVLLNIGGISNFTFLPRIGSNGVAYATDIGPGNTMMNQYMAKHYGREMDHDAAIASQGKPHPALLKALMDDPFLSDPFPKTTGPELFNLDLLERKLAQLSLSISHEDTMATLCHYAAASIVKAIKEACQSLENVSVYISGGGLHNPLLVSLIKKGMPDYPIDSFAKVGVDPDAKEACLFALLANEAVAGDPANVSQIKDSPPVCMGKISLPY